MFAILDDLAIIYLKKGFIIENDIKNAIGFNQLSEEDLEDLLENCNYYDCYDDLEKKMLNKLKEFLYNV